MLSPDGTLVGGYSDGGDCAAVLQVFPIPTRSMPLMFMVYVLIRDDESLPKFLVVTRDRHGDRALRNLKAVATAL